MSIALTTPRLHMTPLVAADARGLFAYRSLPDVCRFQGFAPTALADVQAFVDGLADVAFGTPETWFQLGLRQGPAGNLVGDVGVHFLGPDGRQAELGVTIAPAYQGHGLASEALRAVLEHLFTVQGVHRVVASVDPRNVASLALLRRLGLRQEAHHRQSLWFKGEWVDDVVFAALASEWVA